LTQFLIHIAQVSYLLLVTSLLRFKLTDSFNEGLAVFLVSAQDFFKFLLLACLFLLVAVDIRDLCAQVLAIGVEALVFEH